MWQLSDGRLPQCDGTFPPSADIETCDGAADELKQKDGEMTAQLIWHHDVSERSILTYIRTRARVLSHYRFHYY